MWTPTTAKSYSDIFGNVLPVDTSILLLFPKLGEQVFTSSLHVDMFLFLSYNMKYNSWSPSCGAQKRSNKCYVLASELPLYISVYLSTFSRSWWELWHTSWCRSPRAVHWLLIVFPGWSSGLPAQHSRWPLWEVSGWVSWEQQYWRTGGVLLQLPLPAEGPVQQVSPFSSQFSLLLLTKLSLGSCHRSLLWFLFEPRYCNNSSFVSLCVVLLRVVCRRATGCSVCVCRVMLDRTVKGKRQHSVCLSSPTSKTFIEDY